MIVMLMFEFYSGANATIEFEMRIISKSYKLVFDCKTIKVKAPKRLKA